MHWATRRILTEPAYAYELAWAVINAPVKPYASLRLTKEASCTHRLIDYGPICRGM